MVWHAVCVAVAVLLLCCWLCGMVCCCMVCCAAVAWLWPRPRWYPEALPLLGQRLSGLRMGHRLARNRARYLYCYCAWVLDRRVEAMPEAMPHGGCRDACARTEQGLIRAVPALGQSAHQLAGMQAGTQQGGRQQDLRAGAPNTRTCASAWTMVAPHGGWRCLRARSMDSVHTHVAETN
jgi:hypothetical protein